MSAQQAIIDLPEGLDPEVASAVVGVAQHLALLVRRSQDDHGEEVKLAQDADQRIIDLSRDLSKAEGRVMELTDAASGFLSEVERLLAQHPEPKHGDDRYGYLRKAARNFYGVLGGNDGR